MPNCEILCSVPELGIWDRVVTAYDCTAEQAIISHIYPDLDDGPGRLAALIHAARTDGVMKPFEKPHVVELHIPDVGVPGMRRELERIADLNGLELKFDKQIRYRDDYHPADKAIVHWTATFALTDRKTDYRFDGISQCIHYNAGPLIESSFAHAVGRGATVPQPPWVGDWKVAVTLYVNETRRMR